MRNALTPLHQMARQFVHDMGIDLRSVSILVKEAKACADLRTDLPAFDVWVKKIGSRAGKHKGTLIIFDRASLV